MKSLLQIFIQITKKEWRRNGQKVWQRDYMKLKWIMILYSYRNSGPSYANWSSDSSDCFIDKLSMEISSGKAVMPNSRDTPFPLKTLTTKGMLDSLSFFSSFSFSSSSFSSGPTLGMST